MIQRYPRVWRPGRVRSQFHPTITLHSPLLLTPASRHLPNLLPTFLLALLTNAMILGLSQFTPAKAQVTAEAPARRPVAVINLATKAGTDLVNGTWRYRDAQLKQVDFHQAGSDRTPSGPGNSTYDITPKAGAADFDDSGWEAIAADSLDQRRCQGRLCFNWYRLKVTIPERVGKFDPTGSDLVFEIVVDDYAEIWVDGQLPLVLGQSGGDLVHGFNAPNRVVVKRNVQPGQQIQLAVFGINGPLSNPPSNYIWIRSATLDIYPAGVLGVMQANAGGKIQRLNRRMDAIAPRNAAIDKLAGGFLFTEGPIWMRDGNYLLFSDPNANTIYRWSPDGQVSVYRTKSGYTGVDIAGPVPIPTHLRRDNPTTRNLPSCDDSKTRWPW